MSIAYAVAVAGTCGLFAAGAAAVLDAGGSGSRRMVSLPALWTAIEVLRARVLGEPWALLGYSQHGHIGLIQVAAIAGVYGVSFLVALGNAAIAEAVASFRAHRGVRAACAALAGPAAIIGSVWLVGAAYALRGPDGGFAAQPVAIVQTGVAPAFQWTGGYSDKQRLVLFAESGPLAAPPPEATSESPRAFTAGTLPGILPSFVPLGVSICHEILYPELITRAVHAGADVLVNIANDGWLDGGYGVASRQHFAMAVFRAVESRRYLVRAATTGISGIVDPFGRVLATVPPGTVGAATGIVAARSELTPYVRLGDAFALLCVLHIAALLAAALSSARAHAAPVADAPPPLVEDDVATPKSYAA